MKLLIYGLNYAPEPVGIGKYSGEMGVWLAARGHQVRVLCAPPYYPAWKVAHGDRFRYRRETLDGVDVWRCPLWVPRRPSGGKRLLHLISWALSSLPLALWQAVRWRPDLVLAVEPTFFAAPAAASVAKLSHAKAWLHVQDLEVDAAFDMGILPGGGLRRMAGAIEGWFMRRFDRVSTISAAMRGRLAAKGVPETRLILFPNWVDTDDIRPLERPSLLRAEMSLDTARIVALYAGNLGEKQGLHILLDAARALKERDDMVFVICGDGPPRRDLIERARDLANVRFLPLQPGARLNELLNLADIHLLPQRAEAAASLMPSKLTGMLASGRPVVAGALPHTELARAVKGCGLTVPPDDGTAFANAIEALADDAPRRAALGLAARARACADWDKEAVLHRFEQQIIGLCAD